MPQEKIRRMSDDDLIASFRDLIIEERERLVEQLDHVDEMDHRKLFLHHDSLRAYLVAEFTLEEWRAEKLIRIARLFKRFDGLREMLFSGKLNFSLIEIALGYGGREKLEDPELAECLETIAGKSCRSARRELARLYPQSAELPKDRVRPLTEEHSELRCTVDQELLELVEDVRGQLAHSRSDLSFNEVFKAGLREYRDRHHPEAKARRAQARAEKMAKKESKTVEEPTAQRVPEDAEKRFPTQSLEHQMVLLYGYQCAFVDPKTGKRCQSRHALEKDHVIAWADGGKTEISNLRWACVGHHRRLSFLRFGDPSRYRRPKPKLPEDS